MKGISSADGILKLLCQTGLSDKLLLKLAGGIVIKVV